MNANFFELVGQTITEIAFGMDCCRIIMAGGTQYKLYHDQDCCESVYLEKTIGSLQDILDSPITLAEEDSKEPTWGKKEFSESHTWSAYYLKTSKGRVELWFLGESNGYYSETMSFVKF